VRENVLVAASMTGDPAGVPALADRELARLRLGDLQHRLAGSLSYGDRRRVEIARALALRPRFLLLDEPAAGMNPAETESLLAMLQAVQRDLALGLIVIEHDLHFITRLCRRIVVLNKGQKIAEGSPEEIRRDPAVIDAYIGAKPADPATTATRSAS
jgi:branched-chain amino acid transport system permease protein